MKKEAMILSLMLFAIILSMMVYAVGSSTGNQNTNTNASANRSTQGSMMNCEARATVKDRISCRLQNRSEINSIEESCRNLQSTEKDECVLLQRRAAPCYDKSAREKAACMRNNAGLGSGQLNRFAEEDRRKYAALLMYELQERIEASHEAGRLTDEEAAELIASIVDIKESLLNNSSIADVKAKMTSFRQRYLQLMSNSP